MAITWTDKDGNVVKVTHEGLVVGEPHTRVMRVMSDIYSNETYVTVWDPEKGVFTEVHIGSCFELFMGPWGRSEADLSDEYRGEIQALTEARAKERAAHERKAAEKQALALWNSPSKGKRMVVYKGRKVPIGTEGEVFWVGNSQYNRGLRVGLRDDAGNTHWTDAANVRNAESLRMAA